MKLIHTSDLHIGISLFGEDLLPYQEEIGRKISACAKKHNADCIIISGDVFDSAVVSAEAVKCWDRLCTGLFSGESRIPVIVISGNHDSAPRLSVCSELLEGAGLYIRGSFRDYLRPVKVCDSEIYCIPYFSLSEVKAVFPDNEINTVTDAFAVLTENIRAAWDPGKKHIIAAHCFAAGASLSESERASKGAVISAGGAQMVSADVFAGFEYAALGHLHRPQTVKCPADTGCTVRYSGTPLPYSFSEAEHEKSISVFDTDTGELCLEPFESTLSLVNVKGTFEEIMSRENVPENAFVRVEITDRASAAGIYNTVKEKYPRALRIECSHAPVYTASPTSPSEVEELSPEELAERYIREKFGREMTDEMRQWLAKADR